MPRVSTVRQYPKEFQEFINGLLEEGHSYSRIIEHLRGMGVDDISRSGLGRHNQKRRELVERYEQATAMAEIFARNLKEDADSRLVRATANMLTGIMFQALEGKDGADMKAAELKDLARAAESLGKVRKADIDASIAAEKHTAATAPAGGEGGTNALQLVFVDSPNAGAPVPLAGPGALPQDETADEEEQE